jgi:hypothetical protein
LLQTDDRPGWTGIAFKNCFHAATCSQ